MVSKSYESVVNYPPIRNVIRLHFNQSHARIVGSAVVNAVAEVTKPGGDGGGVELLDARVGV
jgi:hypothetical protein